MNGSLTKVTSAVGAGSRLGFKGSKELGGGLSAIFLCELRRLPAAAGGARYATAARR
ncbi:hypothetical protein [Massilia psychrophila]|uniref:hypothetical protein n=1 Tax=Massilia psychrophila TaxID=1603353 RepID=UPI001E348E68|nr:hypothetical protein [Massilia psychrophila]